MQRLVFFPYYQTTQHNMSSNNAYTKPHSDFSFPSMILSNWKVPTTV